MIISYNGEKITRHEIELDVSRYDTTTIEVRCYEFLSQICEEFSIDPDTLKNKFIEVQEGLQPHFYSRLDIENMEIIIKDLYKLIQKHIIHELDLYGIDFSI